MHYFKRNIGDYHKKAGRLTMLQHGAYTLLMDACYDRERFPTLEDAIDWCWASSDEEIAAVKFVLGKFFVLENVRYGNPSIAADVAAWHARGWIPADPRIAQARPPIDEWKATRVRIFLRDDYTCAYCQQRGGELECDHIYPVSRGGTNEDDNLTTACKQCNRSKGSMTVQEWEVAA